jgi:uncharacterized protein YndB with AHSA1/START domain
MPDIIHRIATRAPLSTVYQAVATVDGIAAWWTRETTGDSRIGGTIRTVFRNPDGKEVGTIGFQVLALEPDKEVRWRFTDGPPEWIGTDAVFTLSRDGDYTVLLFGHRNWREEVEFTAHCSTKWATFLLSLRALVETGEGKPSPDDLKIDNWN